MLRRIVERIWDRFPKTKILHRADAGFAVPAFYEFCEDAEISYAIGQITNSRLIRKGRPWMKKAKRIFQRTGEKTEVFGSFGHRAKSWKKSRRIIAKAEVLPLGENPRFVVTNMPGDPASLYGFYTDRGEMENHIKDLKNALCADRLSCHRFLSNQFRPLLHVAAYILMFSLREELQKTTLASAQMDTLRLRPLKIAAKVVVSTRRVWFHLRLPTLPSPSGTSSPTAWLPPDPSPHLFPLSDARTVPAKWKNAARVLLSPQRQSQNSAHLIPDSTR